MKAGRTVRGAAQRRVRGLPRRSLLLAGSCWEVARFFLVLLLLAVLLETAVGTGPWLFPWLLFAASGNLLVAAGGVLMTVFPARYDGLLAFLRLGKAISVFAFLLLLLSGALGVVVSREVAAVGPLVITLGPIVLGVFVLDLFYLGALLLMGADGGEARHEGEELGGVADTEVRHFH